MKKEKPILFTGIRPTGEVHIANLLAAIHPAVKAQDDYEEYLCIVDLHAITTPYNPKDIPRAIKEVAVDYLAAGINPDKVVLFVQSHVPYHTELMWLLNTITSVGELQRMTQYKEFRSRYKDAKAGILNYPVLMAADILLYKTKYVPVGEDQMQHLELARDLAKRFNQTFKKEIFPIPELAKLTEKPLRIKALNNPKNKMSKSLGPKSYIAIADDPDTIRRKISSAVTDTGPDQDTEKMSAGVANLFLLLKLTTDTKTYNHMEEHYKNKTLKYVELKAVLAESIIDFLKPIQKKREELLDNIDYVAKVLAEGREKAYHKAEQTIKEVKEAMGLL